MYNCWQYWLWGRAWRLTSARLKMFAAEAESLHPGPKNWGTKLKEGHETIKKWLKNDSKLPNTKKSYAKMFHDWILPQFVCCTRSRLLLSSCSSSKIDLMLLALGVRQVTSWKDWFQNVSNIPDIQHQMLDLKAFQRRNWKKWINTDQSRWWFEQGEHRDWIYKMEPLYKASPLRCQSFIGVKGQA